MKKFIIVLFLILLSAGTFFLFKNRHIELVHEEKLEGVYGFDVGRYLSSGDMSAYLADMGLLPEDIINCMETGEEVATGNPVVDTAARLLVMQIQELSLAEVSFLDGGYFVLKMYLMDSNKILANARRYRVIEHEGSVWRFCLYDGHNNYLGLKEAVLDDFDDLLISEGRKTQI